MLIDNNFVVASTYQLKTNLLNIPKTIIICNYGFSSKIYLDFIFKSNKVDIYLVFAPPNYVTV